MVALFTACKVPPDGKEPSTAHVLQMKAALLGVALGASDSEKPERICGSARNTPHDWQTRGQLLLGLCAAMVA